MEVLISTYESHVLSLEALLTPEEREALIST
jgi:hypothetical protein